MFTRVAMFLCGFVNMILYPLLIFGLGMEVKSVAVTTLLSRIISAVIYLTYLLIGRNIFQFRFTNWKAIQKVYPEIVKIDVHMLVYHW